MRTVASPSLLNPTTPASRRTTATTPLTATPLGHRGNNHATQQVACHPARARRSRSTILQWPTRPRLVSNTAIIGTGGSYGDPQRQRARSTQRRLRHGRSDHGLREQSDDDAPSHRQRQPGRRPGPRHRGLAPARSRWNRFNDQLFNLWHADDAAPISTTSSHPASNSNYVATVLSVTDTATGAQQRDRLPEQHHDQRRHDPDSVCLHVTSTRSPRTVTECAIADNESNRPTATSFHNVHELDGHPRSTTTTGPSPRRRLGDRRVGGQRPTSAASPSPPTR